MNKRQWVGMTAVVASALLLAGNVFAVNHVHPGLLCERISGGTRVATAEASIFNNHGTEDMEVICPVVRPDNTSSISDGDIRVHDQNDDDAVECSLRCRDDSSVSFNSSTDNSGIAFTGSYANIDFDAVTDFDNGACYIRCVVPDFDVGASYVISYGVASP